MEAWSDLQRQLSQRRPGLLGATKAYSVLCPLVSLADGQWGLLFEVRATTLRRQPGEVCFPGGRMEPGESPVETALRETAEELGFTAVTVLGEGDFIASAGGFLMHPVLGIVEDLHALCPAIGEVAHTFVVPLSFFRTTPPTMGTYDLTPTPPGDFPFDAIGFPQGYGFQGGQVSFPIWQWNGHVIWGLTARLVSHVINLVDFA